MSPSLLDALEQVDEWKEGGSEAVQDSPPTAGVGSSAPPPRTDSKSTSEAAIVAQNEASLKALEAMMPGLRIR